MLELKRPDGKPNGIIELPPSKSLVNRLLVLDHLRGYHTEIPHEEDAEDIRAMKTALHDIQLHKQKINVGHAGTVMRFLTALLAITPGKWELDGSDRMRQRPIGPLVDALKQLGADIEYTGQVGYPPLHITGKTLAGGHCEINSGISSQFISALLLIAPFMKQGIELLLEGDAVSTSYYGMTLSLLDDMGVKIFEEENYIRVEQGITTRQNEGEADWSAASYVFSMCALSPGSKFVLRGLKPDSLQGDAALTYMFFALGIETDFMDGGDLFLMNQLPVCDRFEYDFSECPDLAQTLAVCCFGLGIEAQLNGLSTLRIKETDRITAICTELEKLGARTESGEDFIIIHARDKAIPAAIEVDTYGDHRMAMSFAPLALCTDSIRIKDEEVVAKSWPGFWQALQALGFSVNLQPS